MGRAGSALVSVLTATIPGRENMLAETVASVQAQTHRHHEHLVGLDEHYQGCAATVNRIADQARGEWLFLIADDDLLLPRCLELHLAAARDEEIVYSPPIVTGEQADQFHAKPPNIPSTALIRTGLWQRLGGYDTRLGEREDMDFWARAIERGARFVRLDEPTWVYRFHGNNKSRVPRKELNMASKKAPTKPAKKAATKAPKTEPAAAEAPVAPQPDIQDPGSTLGGAGTERDSDGIHDPGSTLD